MRRTAARLRHGLWRHRPGRVSASPDFYSVDDRASSAHLAVLYAVYSSTGRLRSYHHEALTELLTLTSDVTVVINQDAPTSWEDSAPLDRCCVLRRPNVGYDFGAWSAAWRRRVALRQPEPERLLLLNDSVYGPLPGATSWLPHVDRRVGVWGPVLAPLPVPHLQSWLQIVERSALRAGYGQRLLQLPNLGDKRSVVARYEVGAASALGRSGIAYSALATVPKALAVGAGVRFNPSHHGWDCLLRQGVPFVKRELLFDDPHGVRPIPELFAVLDELGLQGDVILADLELGRRD